MIPAFSPATDALKDVVRACIGGTGYPFGNPISIDARHHLDIIKSKQYWATPKADGERGALVLSSLPNGDMGSAIVTRSGDTWAIPHLSAPAEFFNGTIVDCEIIGDIVILFDVSRIAGRPASHLMSRRYRALQSMVKSLSCPSAVFMTKDLVPVGPGVELPTFPFPADGIILVPEDLTSGTYRRGITDWNVFKLKDVHTIDFAMHDGVLLFGDIDPLQNVDVLAPDVHVVLPSTLITNGIHEFYVTEYVQGVSITLTYKCPRLDKAWPNSTMCVHRTLTSVAHNVTWADIQAHLTRL